MNIFKKIGALFQKSNNAFNEDVDINVNPFLYLANKRDPVLDIYSDTWAFVSKWAADELARVREMNDSTTRSIEDTSVLRGRIKQLKELLSLGNQQKNKKKSADISDDFAGY